MTLSIILPLVALALAWALTRTHIDTAVGDCVVIDVKASSVRAVVPCDGDQDGRVVAKVTNADACPTGTDGSLTEPGNRSTLACVDLDG